jgi:hypothetical protein
MRSSRLISPAIVAGVLTAAIALPAALQARPQAKPVPGTIKPSTLYRGDKEALQPLKRGSVVCLWHRDEVQMRVTFVNGLDAHITIHVQPNYRIKRGGLHGDGLGSLKDMGVDARAKRRWTADLGKPEGVKAGAPISECSPEINSIELG